MDETYLRDEQIDSIRRNLITFAVKLIDLPYEFGSEWTDYNTLPKALDCSELTEGVYNHLGLRLPDGSQNQYYFTKDTTNPRDGDLSFFGRGGKETQIYHVGLVYGDNILEARAYQPNTSFKTGCVILRPRENWEKYKNWVGYRVFPKLQYKRHTYNATT